MVATPPSRSVPQRSSALDVARRVLDGRAAPRDPSATVALRDLWASLPALSAADRTRAEGMLARPTDGPADPFGFGYTAPSAKKCARDVCVHWVRSTADAPPSKAWVKRTLKEMQRVYELTTGPYGYRKPLKDGNRGGNKKFDVYLKDIGPFGLYGYCAAETRVQRFLATGYCVLDNDFSRTQFPSSPRKSLKVTAAHEFFHAVQYAYDAEDDRWLMEATATWMEERLADDANDNRQYLPYGQAKDPSQPLDSAGGGALNQYGNWAFFEFLSQRFGRDVVRQIWNRMAADKKSPDDYSTRAVVKVLKKKGGFAKVYAEFAAGNTIPGRTYPEGGRLAERPDRRERDTQQGHPLDHAVHRRPEPPDLAQRRAAARLLAAQEVLAAEGEDRRPEAAHRPCGVPAHRQAQGQGREALRQAQPLRATPRSRSTSAPARSRR